MKKFLIYLKEGYRIEVEAHDFILSEKGCVVFRDAKGGGVAAFPISETLGCFGSDAVSSMVTSKGVNILPKVKDIAPEE